MSSSGAKLAAGRLGVAIRQEGQIILDAVEWNSRRACIEPKYSLPGWDIDDQAVS